MSELRCANCREYLFHQPMQCPCGDRVCGKCFQEYQSSGATKFICSLCKSEVLAVTMELKKATIPCTRPGCPWKRRSEDCKGHAETCKSQGGSQEQEPGSENAVYVSKNGCLYYYDRRKECKNQSE